MGILGALGKIATIAGPLVAAPFTGGASLLGLSAGGASALGAGLSAAGSIGSALGSGAASSKAARMTDAQIQSQMDALNNRAMLDAAQHNLTAGDKRLGQVQRADVASSMKDAAPTGDPRIDKFGGGGLRPSAFGADSRTAADEQKRQALQALMSKSDQITPRMSSIPEAGKLEKFGGVAGLVGGLAGAGGGILDALKRPNIMFSQTGKPTGAPNLGYQPLQRATGIPEEELPSYPYPAYNVGLS